MSFSLKLENGDLVTTGIELDTVITTAKLQQDLVAVILTPLGFDELHPNFGSTIIENLLESNDPGILGTQNFRHAATVINSELIRICKNYQAQQIARNTDDGVKFGKSTLQPGEILVAVRGISFTQAETTLICVLELEVGTEIITLPIPLSEPESAN